MPGLRRTAPSADSASVMGSTMVSTHSDPVILENAWIGIGFPERWAHGLTIVYDAATLLLLGPGRGTRTRDLRVRVDQQAR
jgi:hypothetical protein